MAFSTPFEEYMISLAYKSFSSLLHNSFYTYQYTKSLVSMMKKTHYLNDQHPVLSLENNLQKLRPK